MNIDGNSFPLLYKILTEPERELYSIRYLCMSEPECAAIFFSSLDSKTIKKIIEKLIQSRPPYKEFVNCRPLLSTPNFHWLCICLSKILDIDLDFNLIPLFLQYLRDNKLFISINKILEVMKKIYNNQFPEFPNSKINQDLSTKTFMTKDLEAIISLSLSRPQLFRALSPYFDPIFNIYEISYFYRQYGYTILSIMNIENLNLKIVTFNEYPELEDIIQRTILDHFYYNNFIHSYDFINRTNTYEFNSTTTFLYRLQVNFFEINPFPNKTFFGGYSLLYSLLNTSLSKREHFIDVSRKRCMSLFYQNDHKSALDSFSLIPEMESWAVVAVYDKNEYKNNLSFLPEILPLLPQNVKTDISTEFLIRSNNDNKLRILISQMTGNKSVNLSLHSIPFLFKQCLNPTDPIFDFENIYQTPLLSYSDEERMKDCDFVAYYFAIINEIKCITNEENIDKHISNLNQSLQYFSENREKHNNIMIDLFSLLFLKVDGNFICSSNAANKILPLLTSYVISENFLRIFAKNSNKLYISNLIFKDDHKLNHVFLPLSSLFDMTLTSHDWELAKKLEGTDKKLELKRQVFYELYNFSQNHQKNDEIIDKKNSILSLLVSSEIGLSYEDQTEYLKNAKVNLEPYLKLNAPIKTDSNLLVSIEKTNEKECYYLPANELESVLMNRNDNPLEIKTCNQEFFTLSKKLQQIASTQWEKTNISNDYKDCHLFCGFYSCLDGFIPVILESKYATTLVEALSIKTDKLIFSLYSQNKMNDVYQVAKALKMDVFETLILQSNKTQLPFIKEYPIINFSENLFSENDINDKNLKRILNEDYDKLSSEYTFNSKLFTKLREKKNTEFYSLLKNGFSNSKSKNDSNNKKSIIQNNTNKTVNYSENDLKKYDEINDLFYVNDVPMQYYEKVLTDLIQKDINNKSKNENNNSLIDIDKIAEVSFSVSSEFFENLIIKNISKIELNDLKKLSEISNCTDKLVESIETLINVSKDFQPVFPLDNSFRHLLSTGSFKLASDLCRFFRYQMKASKVLRDFALSLLKQSKSIKYVLNVCPPLKNEIIESMPPRFKEKAIQDGDIFFDIIPQKWKRHKDPKTTFIMNLNDDENAYSIYQKMPNLNVDHELLSLFQTTSDFKNSEIPIFEIIKMLSISLSKLLKYFRNPYEPCQKVLQYLIHIVSKISVNENENESYISVLLHRVHTSIIEVTQIINNFFLSTKNQPNQKRNQQFSRFFAMIPLYTKYIHVLSNFVLCLLSTKFGISYSFEDFQTKEKAAELMKISFKFDFPSIAMQFMETWGLADQSTLIDDYALILFKLGLFDEGLKICIDRRMKKSIRTMSIVDKFVDTCSYSQLFDQNSIQKLLKINEPLFKKINKIEKETKYIIDETGDNNNNNNNNNFEEKEEEDRIPNTELLDFITNELQVSRKTLINSSVWNYIQHSLIYNNNNANSDSENTSSSETFVFMPMKTTEDSLRAANRYLKRKAPLFMRAKKLVMIGNFDKALKLAMNNNKKNIDDNNNSIKFNLSKDTKSAIPRTTSQRNDAEEAKNTTTSTNDNETLNIGQTASHGNDADEAKNNINNNDNETLSKGNIGQTASQNSTLNSQRPKEVSVEMSDDFVASDFNNNNNKRNETKNDTINDEINFNDSSSTFNISKNNNSSSILVDGSSAVSESSKPRSTKIVFGTETATSPGSPKKTHIANINSKQRIMQERFNLFLENIFVVSISYSYFSKMKVKLLEFDPTLHFFGSLVEKLLQFSMHNDMPHLKYELEMFLGRTDSAMLTSINLFRETKSISDLENALKAVKKELSSRIQNTKSAPNTLNISTIEVYEKIIPLQIKFMKFIQQQNSKNNGNEDDFEYNKSLSLFNGKKAAISTVIVLFRKYNFSLALEIIITCELDVLKIADDLCDMIYNERNSSMLKMIRSLEDSFPDEIFMKILNQMLLRLFYVIDEGGDLAMKIIDNGLNNEEFRTRLLIQFGQYEKALENAKKWKLFNLMPLIAHESLIKDPGPQSNQISSSVSSMLARVQRSTSLEF